MFEYSEGPYNRFARTPSRIAGTASPYGVAYPSPFFDIAHTFLPDTIKRMFRWCRYYYLTNPLIATVVNKMAEYPITDILVVEENEGLKRHWEDYLEDVLHVRTLCVDMGLYFNCYGNAISSIAFPFMKILKCRHCNTSHNIKDVQYRYYGSRFVLVDCPRCHDSGEADVQDLPIRASEQIKIIIWNPEDVSTIQNELSADMTYFYELPLSLRNDVMLGKPFVVESMPQIVLDAVRLGKAIRLNTDNVYHARRPSLLVGVKDSGLGIPLLLPVLKDTFYLQVLKKATESLAMERIYPLSIVFPQGAGSVDPYSTINLTLWRDQIQSEIMRWRLDRGYIPILPLPVGHEVIGGDGRSLMLGQEIKVWSDQIVAGMGVPNEFVYGGLQWSGSNVSLRMLENQFLRYISEMRRFLNWVVKSVAAYMDWPPVKIRFKPFKMADDLQRKALLFQYNTAGKVSDTTLLADSDLDPVREDELMKRETTRRLDSVKRQQLAQATIQGEAQVLAAKFQARAQAVMMEEQQQALRGQQQSAPGEAHETFLGEAGAPQPAPQAEQAQQQQLTGPQSANRPLPNSLPPRRGPQSAAI